MKSRASSKARKILFFTSLFLSFGLFVRQFVLRERYIYFWDYATYYSIYNDLAASLIQNPFSAIAHIFNSMRLEEYNLLPAVFLMPFHFAFGSSRLAYVSAIAVTFAFPAIVLFTKLVGVLRRNTTKSESGFEFQSIVISALTLALLPQFWIPILLGYLDVVGVVVIFLVFIIYFRYDLLAQNYKSLIYLGLLCSALILLRRWYAFWVVGFFVAVSLEAVFKSSFPKLNVERLKSSATRIFIIGIVALLSFFALASKIAVKMLVTNYSEIYSAYRNSDSIFGHIEKMFNHFGLLTIICIFLGFIVLIYKRRTRTFAAFLFVNFAVTFVLFTRTQDVDVHHNYWIISILAIFVAVFICEIYEIIKPKWAKIAFCVVALSLGSVNFFIVFEPKIDAGFNQANFLFSRARLHPKQRSDFDQVHELLSVLNNLTENSDDKIYVLASSETLNSEILKNGCDIFESDLLPLKSKILKTNDVDKRDGFPFQFFTAHFVIVTNPIQYHLSPENQKVVGVLAEQFNRGEGLAKSYQKLPFEFVLENGARVVIFEKRQKLDASELQKLADSFIEFYPNQRKQFEIKPEFFQN